MERQLNRVFAKMGLPLRNYGNHSYRKFFATKVYMDNEMDIELVRVLLQHSSVSSIMKVERYLNRYKTNNEFLYLDQCFNCSILDMYE